VSARLEGSLRNDEERDFWRKTYLAFLALVTSGNASLYDTSGKPFESPTAYADTAVMEFRSRCPK
jgi:regulation of enolase protein 1 (concanavalin A-like superfamily)